MIPTRDPINILAAFGLALGAVFGMAGTFTAQPNLQALFWAIDGCGLVMAAALLAMKYSRKGHDLMAGRFLTFGIAEAVMLSGTAGGHPANVPAFTAGTAQWATALPLISLPRQSAPVVRILGMASAILFAIVAVSIFWGEQLLPTSTPLPSYAYPFLVMTFISWIGSLLRLSK